MECSPPPAISSLNFFFFLRSLLSFPDGSPPEKKRQVSVLSSPPVDPRYSQSFSPNRCPLRAQIVFSDTKTLHPTLTFHAVLFFPLGPYSTRPSCRLELASSLQKPPFPRPFPFSFPYSSLIIPQKNMSPRHLYTPPSARYARFFFHSSAVPLWSRPHFPLKTATQRFRRLSFFGFSLVWPDDPPKTRLLLFSSPSAQLLKALLPPA